MGCEGKCECAASRSRIVSLLAVLAHRDIPASRVEGLVGLVVENEGRDLMIPAGLKSWAEDVAERIFDD